MKMNVWATVWRADFVSSCLTMTMMLTTCLFVAVETAGEGYAKRYGNGRDWLGGWESGR